MSYDTSSNSSSDHPQSASGESSSSADIKPPGAPLPKLILRTDVADDKRPNLIPRWTSVASAWCGVLATLGAIALPIVGKWRRAARAAEGGHWFSNDLLAPFPLYFALAALALGMVVLWQSRQRQKPYPAIEINHRVQAWAGIMLGMIALALIYLYALAYVAWRAF
jgi:hypothetical protein